MVYPEATFRAGYDRRLRLFPDVAQRIVAHVDAGVSLVEGIQPPLDPLEVHIVHELHEFKHAGPRKQAIMLEAARHAVIAELDS